MWRKAYITMWRKVYITMCRNSYITMCRKAYITMWMKAYITVWRKAYITMWRKAYIIMWRKAYITMWVFYLGGLYKTFTLSTNHDAWFGGITQIKRGLKKTCNSTKLSTFIVLEVWCKWLYYIFRVELILFCFPVSSFGLSWNIVCRSRFKDHSRRSQHIL